MMCDAAHHSDNWLLISRAVLESDPELIELLVAIQYSASVALVRPIDDEARAHLMEIAAADPAPFQPHHYE